MRTMASVVWLICLFMLAACQQQQTQQQMDPVAHGRHMVMLLDCDTCHSPKVPGPNGMPLPDTTRRLSGHPQDAPYPTWYPSDIQERHALGLASMDLTAWAGPWGVSFATNLTPDKTTGLGEWTEEAFIQAIRTGKHQGQPNGRDILPPMPWFAYRHAPDEDLKAIWAYLQTLPPVKNEVPLPIPPPEMPVP